MIIAQKVCLLLSKYDYSSVSMIIAQYDYCPKRKLFIRVVLITAGQNFILYFIFCFLFSVFCEVRCFSLCTFPLCAV